MAESHEGPDPDDPTPGAGLMWSRAGIVTANPAIAAAAVPFSAGGVSRRLLSMVGTVVVLLLVGTAVAVPAEPGFGGVGDAPTLSDPDTGLSTVGSRDCGVAYACPERFIDLAVDGLLLQRSVAPVFPTTPSAIVLLDVLGEALTGGVGPCTQSPFTPRWTASVERAHPWQRFTAYVFDERTGCSWWWNPESRHPTASVFKVLVMAGTLATAEGEGRPVTDWEMARLEPMIRRSADWPVRELWYHFDAAPWFGTEANRFGLDQTTIVGDHDRPWGITSTSARDQVVLLRAIYSDEVGLLTASSRDVAWSLMSTVEPDQTWGMRSVAGSDPFVVKNGFAGVTANSIGMVELDGGYAYVAILTTGWSNWTLAVDVLDDIGTHIGDRLRGWPGPEHASAILAGWRSRWRARGTSSRV